MSTTKLSRLAAVVAAVDLGNMAVPVWDEPLAVGDDQLTRWKQAPGNKGRSNNKAGARLKDRERAKAAHRARMAQKRKK